MPNERVIRLWMCQYSFKSWVIWKILRIRTSDLIEVCTAYLLVHPLIVTSPCMYILETQNIIHGHQNEIWLIDQKIVCQQELSHPIRHYNNRLDRDNLKRKWFLFENRINSSEATKQMKIQCFYNVIYPSTQF